MYTIGNFYDKLDEKAPFKYQEKYDNSGLLVGSMNDKVTKVMISLDITNDVIDEAKNSNCNLIISHHPVIFDPIYKLDEKNPVYKLVKYGIAAICTHTCMDMSNSGMNKVLFNIIDSKVKINEEKLLDEKDEDRGFGMICRLQKEIEPTQLAKLLKEAFSCTVVRYYNAGKKIKRLAFCSGAGGSALQTVIKENVDAYITGDVKHDQFTTAKNYEITLFDCGHYNTETVILKDIKEYLEKALEGTEIVIAKSNKDSLSYEI